MTKACVGVLWIAVASVVALMPVHALKADSLVAPANDTIFANGFEAYTLAIDNYLAWCSLTEDGVAYSASKLFSEGAVVALHAEPLSGFIWGYWTGTDAGGNDTNKDAVVTMSSDRSVLACCPFASSPTCP